MEHSDDIYYTRYLLKSTC